MTIEGKIVNVMETWPLQLTVETEKGPVHVMLQPEADALGSRELQPGTTVRIEGSPTGAEGLTATAITLMAEPKTPAPRSPTATSQEDRGEGPQVKVDHAELPPVEMPPPFEES